MSTPRPHEVPSITGVPASLAEDQSRRLRQYLLQMGLRIVLILAAALLVEGWLMWVCFAGAVVLPYSAVLLANAGRDRSTRESSGVPATPPAQPRQIEATTVPLEDPGVRVVEHTDDPPSTGTADRKDD
ncbi:Protein of unknown function (DUF3099) [Isoptericola sp. CG 20/1183]|uniref:DUF3099 domain-containing protein n=1 Tax=Isoptericola halotolerans TaxID=300560 RepID=A0ABX5EBY6_9MICO|nr:MULTISPECIES: DUF3099 domain-containing protein [Isoptericola]MCK0115905.1 DUF3099 domain-containing protein [Isoptericola sp. S6320L]PRZ02550.1 Protein of unknown function (DUF3099) [Isoptericola sp. CG 20/1183]PRZ02831.1 Protein of unknown function (DUF3099) [Isoptericola halotolerans]